MNDQFLRERAQTLRAIADTADPFTKARLLDLAKPYENNIHAKHAGLMGQPSENCDSARYHVGFGPDPTGGQL